jgi:GMP synthase (glutamine-hydrolysing)
MPYIRRVMRAVILVAGQTLPAIAERRGDFPLWIRAQTGDAWPGEWGVHDLRTDDPLPGARDADAFVITGSACSVTDEAPWMLRAAGLVRDIVLAGTPLLGLCFGHQLIGRALGGEVMKNPRGREIGTMLARRVADDPLLARLPATFTVHATHVDSVTRLPDGATLLAETDLEPVSAFRVGARVWGVQFHPEFDADVMRSYLTARADLIRSEGGDPEALLAGVRDVTSGAEILRSFASIARGRV